VIDAYSASFTATITLLDLADAELAVSVAFIDPDSGQSDALGTYTVGPSAQISNAVPPGTYRLDFREPAGSATGPTCTIEVKKEETYSFIAVPGAIAVSRAGFTPITVRDLFVATSSLCRA
jgi:hypothetical protein